ncbi:hypothetical protein H6G97_37745 [Nostoc flagelliforme FACHB-838]|uniref:Uncharacterized protein n=1 Tax=Nostoc flagelliforme FACHB-838 TaxID=2692904 RepID=A0ABR8DZM2_9NOSO|nr:hypothetical protein [Nostoc flagelliforme]MBD2534879.1 hypothetical protein [Nostoc flagelliforme FACHB-838]
MTLALTGSSYGEIGSRKATYNQTGRNKKIPDFTGELIPAVLQVRNGKSPGNPVVEMTTPKGTINLSEGTNKN